MAVCVLACAKSDKLKNDAADTAYFPPNTGDTWASSSPASLGWDTAAISKLKLFLQEKNSKSFMVLVNGKIVIEAYFNGHTAQSEWEWNSAGKTLVAFTAGIAQQEGLLHINHKVANYLGKGWTNMTDNKEQLITLKHLLSMCSGIDDSKELLIKPNLNFVADAGSRWAYGNVFQKLMPVLAAASKQQFERYFGAKLQDKIGMSGAWHPGLVYTIFHSNTRSMGRFGLLSLNKGKWKDEQIVNTAYVNESISPSQSLNQAYGYLTWLNGQSSYQMPCSQSLISGSLIPNAPADTYAAMGFKEQRLYVVPSKKMVIVRMGNAADPNADNLTVNSFDVQLWEKLNAVFATAKQ